MKRSLALIAGCCALIAGLLIGSPGSALAYDINVVPTYFQANDLHLDQTGNLSAAWEKIQLVFYGYALPLPAQGYNSVGSPCDRGEYLYATINGTSSVAAPGLTFPIASTIQTGSGAGNAYTHLSTVGADFGGASQAPYGNVATSSQIADALIGVVSTTALTLNTPIWINLGGVSYSNANCVSPTYSWLDGQQLYLNANLEPLSSFFLQPFAGETINDFPSWIADVSNNTTSSATGTIVFWYGSAPGSMTASDTASFALSGLADAAVSAPKTIPLTFPQQTTTTRWYAQIELISGSVDLTGLGAISFYTNPSAQSYQAPPIGSQFFNQSSSEEYSINCGYTSSSFFADPVANVQIGLCNTAVFLGIPSKTMNADLATRFGSIWGSVANKPPFGYFSLVSTDLGGFTASTTASTTLLDTTGTAIIGEQFGNLDQGLAAIIGLLLMVWLFHRARLFEF
jgi:hypothetical protein